MAHRTRFRVPALAAVMATVVLFTVPAQAAGKTVHITKSESDGDPVAGATFTLYRDDPPVGNGPPKGAEDTVAVGTCTTAANGQCDITNVPRGDYWVSETGPPSGYVAAADSQLKVRNKNREVVVVNDKSGTNRSVNDPTGDASVDDGTHIVQFGPAVAASPNGKLVGVAFNDFAGFATPGGVSGIGWAFSEDRGRTFTDLGKVPPGDSFIGAEPTVVYDHRSDRFIVAAQGAVLDGSDIEQPILVSVFDHATGGWTGPVNTFSDMPGQPASAHGAWLAIDDSAASPFAGTVYLVFTVSDGTGGAEGLVTRSRDGGLTWSTPVPVTGAGTNDSLTPAVAPDGRVYVTWTDFGAADTNDIRFSVSHDGGRTWSDSTVVRAEVPKSGTTATCGSSSRRTYLGELATLDAPRLVVSPVDPDQLFLTVSAGGTEGDEGDIRLLTSGDGGVTWIQRTIRPSVGTQMFPDLNVTPDGRVGVSYYDARETGEIEFVTAIFSGLQGAPEWLVQGGIVNETSFAPWETNPSFDTFVPPCFGMQGGHMAAPGSGFYLAWADGSDPGPAGNGGIDPNIRFARFDGAYLPTTTTVSIAPGRPELQVSGVVDPFPVPRARVTVTLFVDDDGAFERVDRRRPRTNAFGRFDTSFARPDGGVCRVVVSFPGSDGRVPSSAAKTFPC